MDAHTHIGLDGYGIGYEGCDYNEMNDIWTPQLRAIDGINPRDPSLADARKAGVTCVCTGPGSANVLGGTFLAMKTVGERVDNMIVRDPVAMKCAFGENPKRCYRDKCDSTRMSTAAFLRGALMQARDYGARKQAANGDVTKMPAYNQKLEALLPVLAREIPLKAHAHQANDIFTALRIAREFNLRLTLEHVTEGHLIADELAKEKDVPMAVGPSLTFASKFELQNKSWKTPGVLANGHGPFTWGKSGADAVYNAVVLEELSKMALMTRALNPAAGPCPATSATSTFCASTAPTPTTARTEPAARGK